ncbi:MAG TPA: CaiB/BaiF CoA-transferase family protein [Myxococcales bacterium]|jgi:crotonobetainyl-CoA:carnitine CoA-transferase CaiB-like acyl-CoA transferase|nr:CaiB/BaiF CoA-transferase family protein [Myxococcales bacterium]
MGGPLAGVRVLDLTRHYPGPYATLLLSDLGADVIKLEDAGEGDPLRGLPEQFEALNRGKRSIAIDLKTPEGASVLRRLCARADVLIEGFRPGVLARLGCAPEALGAEFPRLIICSLSGFGQTGPMRERAGHDIGYLAASGLLSRFGTGDQPVLPGAQIADFFAGGQQAVVAVLAALVERNTTGRGRILDVAMCEGTMQALFPRMADASSEDVLRGDRPCYRVYACREGGAIALGALEPKFWHRFCAAVSRPDWEGRQFDASLTTAVDELFLERTRDEWAALLASADCCAEPVLGLAEIRPHAQHRARQLWLADGRPRTLPPLVPTPDLPARRAPLHGEHGREVLRDAGFTEEEISALQSSGVAN